MAWTINHKDGCDASASEYLRGQLESADPWTSTVSESRCSIKPRKENYLTKSKGVVESSRVYFFFSRTSLRSHPCPSPKVALCMLSSTPRFYLLELQILETFGNVTAPSFLIFTLFYSTAA